MRRGGGGEMESMADWWAPETEIKTEEDLIASGAAPGTVANDLEQATGLERLEILGKMEGIDIFDMKPLDASRKGTSIPITTAFFSLSYHLLLYNRFLDIILHSFLSASAHTHSIGVGTLDNPITVQSFGEEQYLGCTGCPADSHTTIWLTVSKNRPIERCPECGSVYKMDYVGPEESHDHHHGDRMGPWSRRPRAIDY
jgi:uncharacterized Zn-finger protein